MSMVLLGVVIVGLTAAVVVAIFLVMWRARTSTRQTPIVIASAVTLGAWAFAKALLCATWFLRAVVAVGLGVMTSPGPAHVFHTTPTSQLATQFPLALVPTFLVPLAFVLHGVSLWQLRAETWMTQPAVSSARSR